MRFLAAILCVLFAGLLGSCSDDASGGSIFSSFTSPDYVEPPFEPRSTWAAKILADGKIPDRGFLAAYFDRAQAAPVFHTEEVDSIAVKYAWDELHQIKSENFAAYWIGQIDIPEGGKRTLAVSQSWARSRIFIDGKLVFPHGSAAGFDSGFASNRRPVAPSGSEVAGKSGEFTHYFAPGKHLIEVEFVNNWHTTEYKVTIGEVLAAPLNDSELRSALGKLEGEGIFYVGLYESDKRDTSVEVDLPRTGKPAIVWLDSYEGVDWSIDAPDGVEAVVIASYSPGSRVVAPDGVKIFRARSRLGIREVGRGGGCHCVGGRFRCEQSGGIAGLSTALGRSTGKSLIGLATAYSTASISVRSYDDGERARAQDVAEKTEEARRICEANGNPDVDKMFD